MKISSLLKFVVAITILTTIPPDVFAAQYTAYSLKVAQQRIEQAGENWRQKEPDVVNLAGINKVEGFVFDSANSELILVGQKEQGRAALTLDDLVVALRARFRYNEWPLVSIDPTPDTEKTQMQHIRFEGGIQDTSFGQAMFDADYRLKEIGMGLQPPGIVGLKTYWDRSVEETQSPTLTDKREVNSRFWFYPINPHVTVREGVCVVRGLKVGVFTEVMGAKIDGRPVEDLKAFKDQTGDAFATDVSERFEDLCRTQPSFNRLRGLQELVAVSKALEELEQRPEISYWLEKYPLAGKQTQKEVKVLRRKYDGKRGWFEVSGGVHLTALAMRLNAGDVTALREAVLKVRPSSDQLTWTFVAAEWLIPIGVGQVKPEDIAPLFQQALFLAKQERLSDALVLYDRILEIAPSTESYCNRGVLHRQRGDVERALVDYDRALALDPNDAITYLNRGNLYLAQKDYKRSIEDFDRAILLSPDLAETYNSRGAALTDLGLNSLALKDLEKALLLKPHYYEVYCNRGILYGNGNMYNQAIDEFKKAVATSQIRAEAHGLLSEAYIAKIDYDRAIQEAEIAVALEPQDGKYYCVRAKAYIHRKNFQKARADILHSQELGFKPPEDLINAATETPGKPR